MTTTISNGTTSTTPAVDMSAQQNRPVRNLVHPLIGSPVPDVTLRDPGARTGSLELVYATDDAARAAESLHRTGGVFTLTDDQQPDRNMTYVLAPGALSVRQELPYQHLWVLTVPYQEVAP